MMPDLPPLWKTFLGITEADLDPIYLALQAKQETMYPPEHNWFSALELTAPKAVKVIILGQDPYHGKGEANGLAFSVSKSVRTPPSLQNIFKELATDIGLVRENPDLTDWAKQGVLLLNSILTVKEKVPASHRDIGWESLTDRIIEVLSETRRDLVFILWGNFAKKKIPLIAKDGNHLILESSHPSFYSANQGFFGSKPFSKTNQFLKQTNQAPVKWI